MSRELASEHYEKAAENLETARTLGPGSGSHFAALAQAHALLGVLAVLAERPRPTAAGEPLLTRQHGATCSCERCYL